MTSVGTIFVKKKKLVFLVNFHAFKSILRDCNLRHVIQGRNSLSIKIGSYIRILLQDLLKQNINPPYNMGKSRLYT